MEGIPKKDTLKSEINQHQKRWEDAAAETQIPLLPFRRRDDVDFMRAEAMRENDDFDKRQHEDFLLQERQLKRVVESMFDKLYNPESKKKILVYIMGGGMKASGVAGSVWALNEMGLTAEVVDVIVGASSGAVVAASYAGGVVQTEKGIALLTNELSSKEFIDTGIGRVLSGNMINLQLAEQLLESGQYALNQDEIRQSSTQLYFTVTNPVVAGKKPTAHFINAKGVESIPVAITVSMAIPGFTGTIPQLNGETVYDGSFDKLPIEEILESFPDVTDVLVLSQDPFQKMDDIKPSMKAKIAAHILNSVMSPGPRQWSQQMRTILLASEDLRKNLEKIQTIQHINIGILYPPDEGLSTVSTHKENAKAAIIASARNTFARFGVEEPASIMFDYAKLILHKNS